MFGIELRPRFEKFGLKLHDTKHALIRVWRGSGRHRQARGEKVDRDVRFFLVITTSLDVTPRQAVCNFAGKRSRNECGAKIGGKLRLRLRKRRHARWLEVGRWV